MVLGCGAQHRRTPHIDLLHRTFLRGIRIQDGGLERVEIDDQQIDPADAVFFDGGIIHAAAGQQSAMNCRMKRLDAAVQDFGEAGKFGNLQHFKPRLSQRAGRAPSGNQLESEVDETPGKFGYAGLVGDADEGAAGRRRAAAHPSNRSYSFNFLRRVPRLMPRIFAAWLLLPPA